jgi:hypothetical protein
VVVTAAIVAASLALVGCSSLPWARSQPRLYSPVAGSFGVGQSGLAVGERMSQGDIPLCIDRPGTVTITGVEPLARTNGMRVIDFAVRTIPAGSAPLGGAVGDLSSMGMSVAEQKVHQVTWVCGAQARSNVGLDPGTDVGDQAMRIDLVVTLAADALPAVIQGLRIHYSAEGHEDSTEARVAFAMCEGKTDDECTPPDA